MNKNFVKVKMYLKSRFPQKIQIFNSRNMVGDYMETICHEGKIIVDWCEHYNYIEVFGVSAEEYKILCDEVGTGHWNGSYEGN